MFEKIKKFFRENWKFVIFIVAFYAFMNYELPFVIYTPGGAIDMSERVSGENVNEQEGSLSMTYVSMVKGSLPFLGLSYLIPNWDIVSKKEITYDGDNLKDTIEIDKIYLKEAISNAERVAYDAAGIEYREIDGKSIVTYVSDNAKTNLHYNDELLSVDGMDIDTLSELQEYITSKNVGDKVRVLYKRNGEEKEDMVELIDIGGKAKIGLSIAYIADYDTPYNISVKSKSSESGPSGGLITALQIYNMITENDLTHGKIIMGTGTMERDGTVGEIGGVKYKLIGAVKNGAEVFICPEENYAEALSVKNENKYDIDIVSAHTFKEALTKIENID